MMNITQLSKLLDGATQRAGLFIDPLNKSMVEFDITTSARQASFMPQVLHESNYLRTLSENLNYTPEALMAIFNTSKIKRFDTDTAKMYGRTIQHAANQPMIASIAYANRMGNGSIESGDGWAYRGRGLIQLTGKDNYTACGAALGIDLVNQPELLEQYINACRSAAWFWQSRGLNKLADAGDQVAVSKRVNGGTNGLSERLALFKQAQAILT